MIIKFIIFFGVYLFLTNLAVNIGYHRYLSHKSFEMTPWFRYLVILIGLPAGTPIQWAGNHRQHHRYSDGPLDPHSPYNLGLWNAHTGWYIGTSNSFLCFLYAIAGPFRTFFDAFWRPRTNQQFVEQAQDIKGDAFFSFISRPWVYTIIVLSHLCAYLAISYFIFDEYFFPIAWFCSACVYNLGDAINSLGHYIGEQPFKHPHRATNHWLLAMITFGDGWHASHHSFGSSAKHGLLPGQFDWTYILLKFFEKLRMVYDIKSIDPKVVQQALK